MSPKIVAIGGTINPGSSTEMALRTALAVAEAEGAEVKLFGGARMMEGLSDIGAKNAEFAKRFLTNEGIRIVVGKSYTARIAKPKEIVELMQVGSKPSESDNVAVIANA
mgnify:CR=1 FL=1